MKKLQQLKFSLPIFFFWGILEVQSRCYWASFRGFSSTCQEVISIDCNNIRKQAFYEFLENAEEFASTTSFCFELILSNSNISAVNNETVKSTILNSVVNLKLSNHQAYLAEDAFSTFSNLSHFTAISSEIPTSKIFKNHGKLQELVLNNNSISKLQHDDFINLQALRKLDLSYNNLQTVNNFTFHLLKLEELHVSNNSISKLDPDTFVNNQNLVILKLSFNKLQLINNNTFTNLRKLEQLWLDHNLLDVLQDKTFQNLKKLLYLYLNNNKLQVIFERSFKGLDALHRLHLENNNIKTITPGSLSNFGRLFYLDLRGNFIKMLENGTFEGATSLRTLNLTSLNIESIQPGAFRGMSELTHLDLETNKLQVLEIDAFLGLTKLQQLLLGNNGISVIKPNAFQSLTNLKSLNIEGNNISLLKTDMFNGLDSLVSLEMIDLSIKEIEPGAFNGLSNLDTLVMGNSNEFTVQDGSEGVEFKYEVFQGLKELKTLYIKNFNITAVHAGAFKGLKNLQKISLENCSISKLDHGIFADFNNLWFIKSLWNENKFPVYLSGYWYDFGKLSIRSIEPETLADLFKKKHFFKRNNLYLNGNKLSVLQSDTFSQVVNMVELALDDNEIETIEPGAFNGLSFYPSPCSSYSKLRNLTRIGEKSCNTLDLKNNRLKVLKNYTFDNIRDMVVLNLDHNKIEEIESDAFSGLVFNVDGFYVGNVSNIANTLRLDNNKLKILRNNTFGKLKNLVALRLNDNSIEKIEPGALNTFTFYPKACVKSETGSFETDFNTLYLNNNNLTILEKSTFNGMHFVVGLRLDNNSITEIEPGAFKGLSFSTNLCYFDERFRVSSMINDTTRYNALYLNNNKLNRLVKNAFVGTKNLTVLRLDNNNIKMVESGAFADLNQLLILNLENNKIEMLERDVFKNLETLQKLDLSNNEISKVSSESFSGLTKLQDLFLQNNKILEIPLGTFKNFFVLENLQLESNNITAFKTGSFSNMANLKFLNISHNSFSALNETIFYPLKSLQLLDLHDNNFAYINYTALLLHLPYLQFISINNNNWACPFLINMVKTFKATGINYLFNSTLQYSEENVDGISCTEITDDDASASDSDEDKSGIDNYKMWMKEISQTVGEIKENQNNIKVLSASPYMISLLNKMNSKFDKFTSLQEPINDLNERVTTFSQILESLKQSSLNKTLSYKETIEQNFSNLENETTFHLNPSLTMIILLLCILCLIICLVLVAKTCNIHLRNSQRKFNRTTSHLELIDTST